MTHTEYLKMVDICATGDAFYFVDQQMGDSTFRMFNYRMASYADWLVDPITFEMRGLMVEITAAGGLVRVASRPPAKFFNLNENPFVVDLDLNCIGKVASKLDGSLISTFVYTDNGVSKLGLKSKMSLHSSQSVEAMNVLNTLPRLYTALFDLAIREFTVYCEFCSPTNRIVVGYPIPTLTVLGVRDRDGNELNKDDVPELAEWWVDELITDNVGQFVSRVGGMSQLEGFVITLLSGKNRGTRFKVKCDWYMALHHTKDSINNPRRLYEAILNEGIDDLRAMFFEDKLAIKLMDEMQVRVDALYKNTVHIVETFYRDNKELDRKSYAIKGQAELDRLYFGLAMQKYIQKPVDYKEFLKSKYKEFGFKDEPVVELVED